jgi:hypothetical protein
MIGERVIHARAGKLWRCKRCGSMRSTPRRTSPDDWGTTPAARNVSSSVGQRVRRSRAASWFAEGGFLYDVVDTPDGRDDATLRPNQIFAVSTAAHADPRREAIGAVVSVVTHELLTPYGLRTLGPRRRSLRPVLRWCTSERATAPIIRARYGLG